ncbi:MAG TPA: cytochrome P450 [Solirubrobacterales bacterium]|jgi:cytochrome P450|nr:cytochrome P450 [Solirubrobacterales bacterium]
MEEATLPGTPVTTEPPGSRRPAVANAVRYLRNPLEFGIGLHRRHGDIFRVSFPYFGEIVYVADPALVKQLFTGSPKQFHAGEANSVVLELALGPNSVLTLDDEAHLNQRKLLLPPFHGEQIKNHGELIREITLKEMQSWPVGKPFPLRPRMQRITLAVIMRAVFGVHDEARLTHFEHLIETFNDRVTVVLGVPMLRRNLGRWSPWRRFQRAKAALDEFIYEEIALRRAGGGEDGAKKGDILSLLLEARHDDHSPMSDEELRDELITVLAAGHETTATELSWTMERLLRTPRVMAKLRESLAAGEVDYLDATIKETLRARPVIIDVARKMTEPGRIGGYELPAGTYVMAAIAAMHYREDLFPNPKEFRPERFLEEKADNYAWIPFGGGVRRCIGASFAEYEMRIILREIIEGAALSAPNPKPEPVRISNLTLAPSKGTVVKLDRPLH